MTLSENTLARIVLLKPAAASVFEKHDLDYCCHGKQTLQQACDHDHLKLKTVERELEALLFYDENVSSAGFSAMPVPDLIEYLVNRHHRYVKEATPRIMAHLQKVSSKHGDRHPELHEIYKLFAAVSDEMGQHMHKEEHILFPRIKEIAFSADNRFNYREHEKSYLTAPIHRMESEHETAGKILHQIRSLTHHFIPPADACTTFKLAYSELNEYERDLHRHVHLENNILFPKAMELFDTPDGINLN
jgi:regulator of cell morphogenesis and NO signaling